MTMQPEMPEDRLTPRQHEQLRKAAEDDADQTSAVEPQASREITFKRSLETEGWPDPVIMDSNDLSDGELANYIEVCGTAYDGIGNTLRDAVVRLLRW